MNNFGLASIFACPTFLILRLSLDYFNSGIMHICIFKVLRIVYPYTLAIVIFINNPDTSEQGKIYFLYHIRCMV